MNYPKAGDSAVLEILPAETHKVWRFRAGSR